MTTPPTILSEQEIANAWRSAKRPYEEGHEISFARAIESAVTAKLAQGVELEVVGRLDVSKYRGHLENYSFDLTADDLDGSYPLVPLSTAQAAVAAERAKAHRCKGLLREGCDYLASCGSICNKCGREHTLPIQSSPAPAAEPAPADRAGLVEECKLRVRAVRDESWHSAHGAQGVNVGQRLDEAFAAIDRIASSAAQVPEDARDAARYRWLRDASRFRDGGLIVGEAEGEDVAWGDHLDLLVDREMAEGPADPAAEPAADWDDNPEGVVAGEESGPRMDPHTGVWDEPEAPGELCRACDGTGRVPSPKECLRCGMRGCQSDECTACGGTGEVAAAPAAGGEQS